MATTNFMQPLKARFPPVADTRQMSERALKLLGPATWRAAGRSRSPGAGGETGTVYIFRVKRGQHTFPV